MKQKNLIEKILSSHIFRLFVFIITAWIFFLVPFLIGYFVYSQKIWPHKILYSVQKFIEGHPEENVNLFNKILNDLEIKPSRSIDYYITKSQNVLDINSLPLKNRRDNPKMFLSENATEGYRTIFGAFDFKNSLHGLLLINPNGEIVKHWELTQDDVNWRTNPDSLVFPHGFEMGHDGSFVVAYDFSTVLTKYNYCGEIQWRIPGIFDHIVSFDNKDETIWVSSTAKEDPNDQFILNLDYNSGKILKKITIPDLIDKNTDIGIFAINQNDTDDASFYTKDPFHFNDIEALSENLAKNYPLFQAGDLLLSFRSLNLVCVIDPDTLKVKWWRQGLTRRQHDPDWNNDGTISIFNNNMHQSFSNIIEINPNNYSYSNIIKGSDYDFYTRSRGKHQKLSNGNFLISSTRQGRAFEVDTDGDIVFEFINTYKESDEEILLLSEARYFPSDYFNNLPVCN